MTDRGSVLVVDDSATSRMVLVRALERLGYTTTSAEDGRRALELLSGTGAPGVDVVLLDLLMPVMDGEATLCAIKADLALRHLPVIVISAVDELESAVRCIELGATDYLPKPFNAALLKARLQSSLAAKRLRDLELDYLQQVDRVIGAAAQIEAGVYDGNRLDAVAARDDALGRLARMFQRMALEVANRESALRREVAELRIEIDRTRKARQVAEITESEYYRRLTDRAGALKDIMTRDSAGPGLG
jgi:two-component system, cell cycle response regulator